jgi:hypothetical protein
MTELTIHHVLVEVAREFGVAVHHLQSARRARQFARPRQVAMYFAYTFTRRSFTEIGRYIGGRDHTTIMHGVDKVAATLEAGADAKFLRHIRNLQVRLVAIRQMPSGFQGTHVEVEEAVDAFLATLRPILLGKAKHGRVKFLATLRTLMEQ